MDARDARYTKDVRLTHLSLMGSRTFRIFEPFEASLSREEPTHRSRHDIVFQVPCETICRSDYIMFGLCGLHGMDVLDDGMARILGRRRERRATWPMTAPENLLQIVGRGHGRRSVYRVMTNPDDCRAPQRVR